MRYPYYIAAAFMASLCVALNISAVSIPQWSEFSESSPAINLYVIIKNIFYKIIEPLNMVFGVTFRVIQETVKI